MAVMKCLKLSFRRVTYSPTESEITVGASQHHYWVLLPYATYLGSLPPTVRLESQFLAFPESLDTFLFLDYTVLELRQYPYQFHRDMLDKSVSYPPTLYVRESCGRNYSPRNLSFESGSLGKSDSNLCGQLRQQICLASNLRI
jgi:hypothetical protein